MENTKQEKKGRKGFIRVVLLSILLLLGTWSYQQQIVNYQTLQTSSDMTEDLLDHQIALTRDYAQKIALLQASFARTEELLAKVQEENKKLNDQIALLGNVDMQATVDRLKAENQQVVSEITDLKQRLAFESKNLDDVSKGQDLIRDFKIRIRSVKGRIKELRNEAYIQKVAAQREDDRMGLMLGNNGFMTRDGRMTTAEFKTKKDVQVNVKFVK